MNKRTGNTIQNLADILFYVTVIAFIILGGVYWYLLSRLMRGGLGFLVCIIIIGVGVFGAYIYKLLMIGFGEIVEHQSEHTDLLRKMIVLMQNDAHNQTPGSHQSAQAAVIEPEHAVAPQSNNQTTPESQPAPTVQTAEFESRSAQDIVCPICGKAQMSNRNSCYSCGCRFIFRDEQQQ